MAEFSLEEVTGTQPVPPKEFSLEEVTGTQTPVTSPISPTTTTPKEFSLEEVTGTQTAPVETPEKIDEDELDNNQEWLSNALLIYQAEEGEDWKRSKKELSEWFKDRHSKLNWDITNKIKTTLKTEWNQLKDEIILVQKDIQSKIDQKES